MRQLSRRTGFGTLRGMKPGSKSDSYNPKGKIRGNNLMARAVLPDPKRFEEAGATAWEIMEREGFESAMKWLHEKIEELWLTPVQVGKIRMVLVAVQPKTPEPVPEKPKWYSKLEPKQSKPEVDEEISDAFKYWKR